MKAKDTVSLQITDLINKIESLQTSIVNALSFSYVSLELTNRAIKNSADYAEKNMPNVVIFTSNSKLDMWNCAIQKLKINGHLAEFGVWRGESINYLASLVYPKKIFGFDSFLGLEEDFALDQPRGSFSLNGVAPEVKSNVELIKGSFSKTLPDWINNNLGIFSFINIDCDTYEATSTVLNSIGPERIVPGTFILFDEYFGYHNWENCEFKAWQEYCNNYNVKYKYIAICHLQVLIEVI